MIRQLASALPKRHRWTVQPSAALAARGLKTHTGIAGLDVDPNARDNLKSYLQQALEAIKIIPQEAEYRKNVENTLNQKLSFVNSDITDEEVEDKLDAQLEQYINFVKDELSLIPKMAGIAWHAHIANIVITKPSCSFNLTTMFPTLYVTSGAEWKPWEVPDGHKVSNISCCYTAEELLCAAANFGTLM